MAFLHSPNRGCLFLLPSISRFFLPSTCARLFLLKSLRHHSVQTTKTLSASGTTVATGAASCNDNRRPRSFKYNPLLRSPRELVHFRRSRFVAHLNEFKRHGLLPYNVEMDAPTRMTLALTAAGRMHEDKVVEHLVSKIDHPHPLYVVPFAHPDRHELTRAAMQRRVPIIRNAALSNDILDGYADVLLLSSMDPFLTPLQQARAPRGSYTVCEVKLAALYSGDHILQASCYYTMLNSILRSLDVSPCMHAYLWLGSPQSPPMQLRGRNLDYLYRHSVKHFSEFLKAFDASIMPFPDASLEDLTPWRTYAEELLVSSDSLRLIAGIRLSHVAQIMSATGVDTLKQFAEISPDHVNMLVQNYKLPPAARTLHKQAQLQLRSREHPNGAPAYELTPHGPLYALPSASPNDVFFDMEGFPLAPDGGLEYLFGIYCAQDTDFRSWWAHNRSQEEAAFVSLISWLNQHMARSKGGVVPRVFHYGHYEVSALRRVAARAVTDAGMLAANKLEEMIEAGTFFDVYKFVKSALVVGDPSYSIKTIEKIVGITREGDELSDAESSVAMYYEWRRTAHDDIDDDSTPANEMSHDILYEIHSYNRQDCESLKEVVSWLREKFPFEEGIDTSHASSDETEDGLDSESEIEYLPGACGRTPELRAFDSSAIAQSSELSEILLQSSSKLLSPLAAQNLAHILQFYVRESAPDRRLFRDRVDVASTPRFEELFYDDKCVVGARLKGSLKPLSSSERVLYSYAFNPEQPLAVTEGESMAFVIPSRQTVRPVQERSGRLRANINAFITVKSVNLDGPSRDGRLVVSFGSKRTSEIPTYGVLVSAADLAICDGPLRQSVLRRTEELLKGGRKTLVSAFLNRSKILEGQEDNAWVKRFGDGTCTSEDILAFLASRKHEGIFVIQGPPGTGKTMLSGELIRDLIVNHGKTVAVSSNSHAAIDNLLRSSIRAGLNPDTVWKVGTRATSNDRIKFKANVRDLTVRPFEKQESSNGKDSTTNEIRLSAGNSPRSCTKKRMRHNHAALVGATCYQLCREENDRKFDFIFIDEASQVTMAHMVAVGACAKYAVLVGDQRQLEMPIKGAHIGDVGQSCLSYIVGENVTIVEPDRGTFLGVSYRMNGSLCQFVSDAFYDGALSSNKTCADNHVLMDHRDTNIFGGQRVLDGVVFCQSDSQEVQNGKRLQFDCEIEHVLNVVRSMVGATVVVGGVKRALREEDFVVVAPYNAQVRALRSALHENVRVGTVDKFQGQEAAVAVISTCTSGAGDESTGDILNLSDFATGTSVKDSPLDSFVWNNSSDPSERRGIRFCLQANRLNVAVSRAQCLAVVVGNHDACSRLPLNRLEDVELAALFEQLVLAGQKKGNCITVVQGDKV